MHPCTTNQKHTEISLCSLLFLPASLNVCLVCACITRLVQKAHENVNPSNTRKQANYPISQVGRKYHSSVSVFPFFSLAEFTHTESCWQRQILQVVFSCRHFAVLACLQLGCQVTQSFVYYKQLGESIAFRDSLHCLR